MLRHLVTPVVAECGYSAPERADQIAEPGLITSQIIDRVTEAGLVIADLSGGNPNVFYELAVRHATRRPVVVLCAADEAIPFDVAGMRAVLFDLHDLDSMAAAREALIAQVHKAETAGDALESPISAATDMRALRQSADPQKQLLAGIARELEVIGGDVHAIRNDIGIWDRLKEAERFHEAVEEFKDHLSERLETVSDQLDEIEGKFD